MPKTYTTREISDTTGIPQPTLNLWVREGKLNPASEGEGRQRRISWTDDDLAIIREMQDGSRFDRYAKRAKERAETTIPGQVVVTGPKGTRVFQNDTPLLHVVKAVGLEFVGVV